MIQQQSRIIGQQLGHYRLVRLLGSGGFADVYLSEHIHLHTQAAVKILHTRLAETDIEEFRREAQTVALLQHPSIVRVLDFGVEDTIPYLAMDYAPNGSLRNRYPKGTAVPVPEITPILMQVASALQHAHDHRLIHRDIKPENMLLGRNNEVLLSDFGIALVTQSSHSQSTQNIAGTIAYMAPEQIQAHPRPASDQYALGIVVYEWLCGLRPFQGSYTEIAVKHTMIPPPSLCEQIPHLPATIEQVVMKALQKDAQQRFDNMLTFAQAFAQAAQSIMQPQRPSTFTQEPSVSSSLAASATLPAQFMRPAPPPPNSATASVTDLRPSSFAQPSQGIITPSPSSTPSSPSSPSSSVSPQYAVTPNGNPYPASSLPPPPPTPSMQSYSTFIPPPQAQLAGPVPQPAPPQQAHQPSAHSRRSFIGGGIAGLVIAGGIGAWLYTQRSTGGQLPTITLPTSGSSIPNIGTKADTPLLTYSGHQDIVFAISWSPDGNYIASGSQGGDCQIWTADKGERKFSTHSTIQPPISNDFVQSLVWSHRNPPRVAVGFVDGTLQILDVNSRTRISSQDQGYKTYGILSWSPDDKYLAVCKSITEHAVVIYDVATWNIVYTYEDHTNSVRAVAWAPDGKYIASGSEDTTIRIWEPFKGQTHLIYKEHSDDIVAVRWSSDSSKIVSTAQDYVVRIWQPDTGKTLYTHQYPSRAPMGKVAWSHNNQLVAAYPGTGSVDILDAQLKIKQTIQTGVTYDFSWSPDDTRLATANYDNVAHIWRVDKA
jgi:serine/threonine protein kinase